MGTGPSISQTITAVSLTQWTVPANVYYVTATVYGASGKSTVYSLNTCSGGKGAIMSANFTVTANEVLYVNVGGEGTLVAGGDNGGGTPGSGTTYQSGGGGGGSDIRRSPYGFVDRLVVAGGGGGSFCYALATMGGNGGYPNGASGTNGGGGVAPGGGGTSTNGGSGGASCSNPGLFGIGGSMCMTYGGGGGGGWYGGGAAYAAGGGGGSSYYTGALVSHGVRTTEGNGYVKISYIVGAMPPPPSAAPTLSPSANPTVVPSLQPSINPTRSPTVQPTMQPSSQPSGQPTRQPTRQPSGQPSRQPSSQPSTQPSRQPSRQPSAQPSRQPSAQPSVQPTRQPSSLPSIQPTGQPSGQPSLQPSTQPSRQPSRQPSAQPSRQPSAQPSIQPTRQPSTQPSGQPSEQPSKQPLSMPSVQPSSQPSNEPSTQPTSQPSSQPSAVPSGQPLSLPSGQPSYQPSWQPTSLPSAQPSASPTVQPSTQPSCQPSDQPTQQPTSEPSSQPSAQPTDQPLGQPSLQPSDRPTLQPSTQPSDRPSTRPSDQPSSLPSSQPSRNPSGQPTAQPSMQPSTVPTGQPTSPPTLSPSAQPTLRPSSQPTAQPSRQPNSQPSTQPSAQPLSRPSAQPSRQPSRQPSSQPSSQPQARPIVQLTRSPTRPTVTPSARPSAPSARPTARPSKPPTTEWITPVERVTEMQEVTLVNNDVWSCGRSASDSTQSCTVINGASGEVSTQYALPWAKIIAVVGNSDGSGVLLMGQRSVVLTGNFVTEVAYCPVSTVSMNCVVRSPANVIYFASSYILYTRQFVMTGTHVANAIVSFADSTLGTIQSYTYSSTNVKTMVFTALFSVPAFVGTFVVGTCISTSAPDVNYIIFGWVRSFSGAMVATTLKPSSANMVISGPSVAQAITMDAAQLDTFIAGGLQLSDSAGTNAYLVRVNALYQSVLYGVRYRYAVSSARRALSDSSTLTSDVKGVALKDSTLYMLIQVASSSNNRTSVTVLKTNAASGAVLQQAHIEGTDDNSGISCTNIVRTAQAFAIGCTVKSTLSVVQSILISIDAALSFSSLPAGFNLYTDARFSAENVGFIANPLSVSTKTAFISSSQSDLTTTRNGYTQNFPPMVAPTAAPVISPTVKPSCEPLSLPSSAPSSLPSSSPSAAPSVSPQPTSQPSTSGPTNTYKPTVAPTSAPTRRPSVTPTAMPSVNPSAAPSARPSLQPTLQPTLQPSIALTIPPSAVPSNRPTPLPSTVRPSSTPSVGLPPDESETPTSSISNRTSRSGISSYVIGCTVVGGFLLAGLCAWIYYTSRKQPNTKKNNQNTKFFRISPVEPVKKITVIADDLNFDDHYNPHMIVPVVDMDDHGLQNINKPNKRKSSDKSILPSLPAKSAPSSVTSLHSDKLICNAEEGSSVHPIPSYLLHASVVNVPYAEAESQPVASPDDMSSNSSVHSVSTDSSDTDNDSV